MTREIQTCAFAESIALCQCGHPEAWHFSIEEDYPAYSHCWGHTRLGMACLCLGGIFAEARS